MIITANRFTLQPADEHEAHAIRDAIDMAVDAGDSEPENIAELQSARELLGPTGTWRAVDGELVPLVLGTDALELVSHALAVLADWVDDPDYEVVPEALTSSQIRQLAGVLTAWLMTA